MKTFLTTMVLFLCSNLFSQEGVSSGSYSMFQSNGLNSYNERGILNERRIIVEDFVNYHKHKIKIPKDKNPILSLEYDNTLYDDRFVLQIGLATPFKDKLEKTNNNVNVCLVIDNSGSMYGNKLEFVKQAMKTFISELENGTNVSIVVFSSDAELRQKNEKLTSDRSTIFQIIDGIHTAGSTNINAGMMLGYAEIIKEHQNGMNSRLILLTDGMTNTGETSHEKILENSKAYNDKGIEISTIGVGESIDFDLLRSLSDYGRGSNHFIGDSEKDIQKVFINEVESLLYNLGKETQVNVKLPDGFKINKVYGYKPRYISDKEVIVELENLNSGQTQVILMEVISTKTVSSQISAELRYEKDNKTIQQSETIKYSNNSKKITNDEIAKNFSIALMADALKEFAKETSSGSNPSKTKIENAVKFTETHGNVKDEDIKRLYDLLRIF